MKVKVLASGSKGNVTYVEDGNTRLLIDIGMRCIYVEEKLKEIFPDVKCYVSYSAPFWKVRLGDFSNYAEAVVFSKKVKKELPKLAGEIIVTKENNTKPLYLDEKTEIQPLAEEEIEE